MLHLSLQPGQSQPSHPGEGFGPSAVRSATLPGQPLHPGLASVYPLAPVCTPPAPWWDCPCSSWSPRPLLADERHCSHPLSCSLAPPVSTLPDGCWLSFQRGCALKPGGLRSFVCSRAEEGVPRLGSRVAWQHISLSSDSHVPSQRLLMHTPQMTAILQQQLLPSLFTCYLWLLP